jgi:hypothetical protein
MMEAQKSQLMGGPPGPMRGGGPMMRGGVGRPGPYDRVQGPPQGGSQLGRGYGVYGPGSRGSRSFKSKLEYPFSKPNVLNY